MSGHEQTLVKPLVCHQINILAADFQPCFAHCYGTLAYTGNDLRERSHLTPRAEAIWYMCGWTLAISGRP